MGEQAAAGEFGGLAQLGEHLPCKQGVESARLISVRSVVRVHLSPAGGGKEISLRIVP